MKESVPPTTGPVEEIDRQRFCLGPDNEVVLTWWDHKVTFSVLRERAGHQVLVNEDVDVDWTWHIVISSIAALLVVIGSMMMGMPVVYALMLGILLGFIVMGLIMWERKLSADTLDQLYRNTAQIDGETVICMDEPVWEDIKYAAAEVYKRGTDKAAADEVASGRKIMQWLQRLRPMPASAMNDVLTEMHEQLGAVRLARHHKLLAEQYAASQSLTQKMGYGVRHCQCEVCQVVRAKDWSSEQTLPGIAAATKRQPHHVAVGEGAFVRAAVVDAGRREKAKARVEAYDKKRQAQRLAEIERKRQEKARDYVRQHLEQNQQRAGSTKLRIGKLKR